MKPSALRRVFLPLVFGTALSTAGGWFAYDFYVRPVMERQARQILRSGEHKGVESRFQYNTVVLRGTVSSPEARQAASDALNLTGGWGLRVRAEDNRIKVPPSLTMVEVSDTGLRAIGWVKEQAERDALLDLALRQGGFDREQVDVSEVYVYPFVITTGAGAISLSTLATAKEVSTMAWLRGFWESMPKVPRIEGSPEGNRLFLRGRVTDTAERRTLLKWISEVRPDLEVDGSEIDFDPKTKAIILPKSGEAPSPDSWLGPLWTSLTVRPFLRFQAAGDGAEATLAGLVPGTDPWRTAIRGGLQTQTENLYASPAVVPDPDEDLSPTALGSLIKIVADLYEGSLEYAPTGLTIRGEGDAVQLDKLRAIDLNPLPTEFVHIDVRLPEPGRLNGILDGSNLVLRGVAPDTATRDGLIAWIQFVRPDLTVEASKLTIDPMVIRWAAPPLPDQPGAAFPEIESSFPWMRKLVSVLRTGPSIHYRAVGDSGPASFSWFGPTELRWMSTIASAALSGGESNLSALLPGGRISPLVSVVDAPEPEILGQLIGAVSSLRKGEVIYDPAIGLTIRGEVTPAQEQVILAIGAGRMDPAKVHFELDKIRASADSPRRKTTFTAVWVDGTLTLSGVIPDERAREDLLLVIKEGGHRARVDSAALEVQSGLRLPATMLLAELTNRVVATPGNRRFSFTETGVSLSGEVTSDLLRDWKPVLDRLAQNGFGSTPTWKFYPSVYHFPSQRGGGGLPPGSREGLAGVLEANQILFEPGSAEIAPTEQVKLETLRTALREAGPNAKLIAGCHGETAGDPAQNEALNRRRTEAVIEALIAPGELTATQFSVEAFSEVPPSGSEPSSAPSRRVELLLK